MVLGQNILIIWAVAQDKLLRFLVKNQAGLIFKSAKCLLQIGRRREIEQRATSTERWNRRMDSKKVETKRLIKDIGGQFVNFTVWQQE